MLIGMCGVQVALVSKHFAAIVAQEGELTARWLFAKRFTLDGFDRERELGTWRRRLHTRCAYPQRLASNLSDAVHQQRRHLPLAARTVFSDTAAALAEAVARLYTHACGTFEEATLCVQVHSVGSDDNVALALAEVGELRS